MKKIGVIGAGTMGRGVAELFASYNYLVILVDCSEKAVEDAKKDIYNISRFKNIGVKNNQYCNPEQVLENITFTTNMNSLFDADFVVENTYENFEVKKMIYEEIDNICRSDVIFAVNTSCISITKLASVTNRPAQMLGMHFMNPVSKIDAVEVIKGFYTSESTLSNALDLLKAVGKEGVVVNDFEGFVSNRISHLMMNEAAFIVQDGVATPQVIDDIFKKCYGHKMGPLETADLIGLDTVVDSLDILFDSYRDTKFRCCPLLRKMVYANLKGRKTGEGFYKYQ